MTTTYFFAAIQCHDRRAFEEVRTVGAVLLAPEARFGGLTSIPLERKLSRRTVPVVREVLGLWESQVQALAEAELPEVLTWMKARAAGTEDLVRLSAPAFGLTDDPRHELKRLRADLTGYRPVVGRTATDKAVAAVLRAHGLAKRFRPTLLGAGPASWRFPWVAGPHVLHPVEFAQKKPSGVVDAAWRDVGRFVEVRRDLPSLDALVVTPRPDSAAIERAHDVYREAALHVVYAERPYIEAGLARWGLVAGPAEAK